MESHATGTASPRARRGAAVLALLVSACAPEPQPESGSKPPVSAAIDATSTEATASSPSLVVASPGPHAQHVVRGAADVAREAGFQLLSATTRRGPQAIGDGTLSLRGVGCAVLGPDGSPWGHRPGPASPDALREFVRTVRASRHALASGPSNADRTVDQRFQQAAWSNAVGLLEAERRQLLSLASLTIHPAVQQRAFTRLAEAALERGAIRDADAWAQRLPRQTATSSDASANASILRARILVAQRHSTDALALLEALPPAHRTAHRALCVEALAAHHSGDVGRALAATAQVLLHPDSPFHGEAATHMLHILDPDHGHRH